MSGDIDAHVWTPDTGHYPLAKGYRKADVKPASSTPEEPVKHTRANAVERLHPEERGSEPGRS
jgi:hypothetical protein